MENHWDNYSKQWDQVGSPLRPSAEDIAIYDSFIATLDNIESPDDIETIRIYGKRPEPLKILLLGVTPEIVYTSWSRETSLVAIEKSFPMIANFWNARNNCQCIMGNWLAMPIRSNSVDIVIGDGCYTTMGAPEAYAKLNSEIHRVLKKNGSLLQRFFIRPPIKEQVDDILKNPGDNFHAFKWRLAMALQPSFIAGIPLDSVWTEWNQIAKSKTSLLPPWHQSCIDTIQVYKGVKTKYTFPTLEELREVMQSHFTEVSMQYGTYPLAERCPLIHYRINRL